MLTTRLAAVVLGVIGVLIMAVPASAADPLTCAGYPEHRQFVDAQGWWTTTPGQAGTNFGHVHVGACVPEREQMRASFVLDVRVILHNNPGTFYKLQPVAKTDNGDLILADYTAPGWTCPSGTCERWFSVPIDISRFPVSGLESIGLRARVKEPDGNELKVSLNSQAYILNGKTVDNLGSRAYLRGEAWYTGAGYCESVNRTDKVALPDTPAGSYSPVVRQTNHGLSDDVPVSGYTIRLDPDFHNGVPGTILREGTGQFTEQTLPVPPEPGAHKLFQRSDCNDPRGSTLAGVLVTPFTIG